MSPPQPARGRLRWLAAYRGEGLPRVVKALGATSFLQDVASEMVYPLLPLFLIGLGGGAAALGIMESAADGLLAVVKGLAGRWSDRAGRRKPFVAAGYGLSALIRPLMALAASVAQVIGLRMLDRLAKGLRTAPRDAMIAEATPAARRAFAFSYHRGLDHLGAAVGPLAASLVLTAAPGSLRLVFALATLPALAGWAVVQLSTRETAKPDEPRHRAASPTPVEPAGARLPGRLRLPLAAIFLFSLGNASDAFLLLLAARLGYSAVGVALLWSGFHVAKWLASAPSGRLADRLHPKLLVLAGWGLYAAVYLAFAEVRGAAALALLFAVYALFYGLTEGAQTRMVVDLAGEGAGMGGVLGALHLTSGLGTFLASLLFGLLWQSLSPGAAFLGGAGLAALATLLLAASPGRRITPELKVERSTRMDSAD